MATYRTTVKRLMDEFKLGEACDLLGLNRWSRAMQSPSTIIQMTREEAIELGLLAKL
jgi:hypothetical protein